MDRRSFFKQTSASVAGFLVNPTLGVLATVAGVVAAREGKSDQVLGIQDTSIRRVRPLMRALEPVNTTGTPFGDSITGYGVLVAHAAQLSRRLFLAVSHSTNGVSILEMLRDKSGAWRHFPAGQGNARFLPSQETPLDGARISSAAQMYRISRNDSGLAETECLALSPWNTALCGGEWLVEINASKKLAVKKFAIGKIHPFAISPIARRGKKTSIYMLGKNGEAKYLFRFTTHQQFDGTDLTANQNALLTGDLCVANLEEKKWISITAPGADSEWAKRMDNPYVDILIPWPKTIDGAYRLWVEPVGDGANSVNVVTLGQHIRIVDSAVDYVCHAQITPLSPGVQANRSLDSLEIAPGDWVYAGLDAAGTSTLWLSEERR